MSRGSLVRDRVGQPATVYAVIPVYNRLELTRQCVALLKAQSYAPIVIVVADGGSTDGTTETIRREFPDVKVLSSERELWWTGAMAMGIDYALRESRNNSDFLLMMNNDTVFPPDFVSVLVRVSLEERAAVGALTVDLKDPTRILDAGEFIDWESYAFPVKTQVGPGERFFDGVDVLPGRGTLVPLAMIRQAGNVDPERFPHYIADYEFFARLKRLGFRLGVTYETAIKSDPCITGLAARAGERRGLVQSATLLLSRRSMNNFFDHYRFISAAAPQHLRSEVRRTYVHGIIWRTLARLGVAPLVKFAHQAGKALGWLVRPPPSVSRQQALEFGVDPQALTAKGVIAPYRLRDGMHYYFRTGRTRVFARGEPAARLYEHARMKRQRVPRSLILRRLAYRAYYLLFPIYYATEEDCARFGLDPCRLIEDGVARSAGITGRYVLSARTRWVRGHGVATAALCDYARRRGQTLRQLRKQYPEAR
jgi:glycosyltransferase involved in cell wall biosynthesis